MIKQAHNDYITDIDKIIHQLDFRGISKVLTVCYDELDRVGRMTMKPHREGWCSAMSTTAKRLHLRNKLRELLAFVESDDLGLSKKEYNEIYYGIILNYTNVEKVCVAAKSFALVKGGAAQ